MPDTRIEEIRRLLPACLLPDWVRLGARLVDLLRDPRRLESHQRVLDRWLAQARASAAARERKLARRPALHYPAELPIARRKDEILAALRAHQVVIVAGETGSGKTTQLPKICLEAGLGVAAAIGCTQPRRVAALSISRRLADELGVEWGRAVGCKIRFEDRSASDTFIKVMTDGILLAETQSDPLLSHYDAIIIDEAHERSLNIDFLLGYLKGLLARRTDLKLIITSATIDTQAFSEAFGGAPIIEVSGRVYPVVLHYAPLDRAAEERGDRTYVDAAVAEVERIALETAAGDVLVFLPGERDIRETRDLLQDRLPGRVEIIPLFGRLSAGEQERVFAPSVRRKIVIATNIAETSLTIPGIRYVIDSGLARISRYNARARTKRLPVEPISQSSANQRAGRAGRVQDGVCIRLYSEADYAESPRQTPPEILRANLAEVILRMKAFHLGEIETFPFLQPPAPAAIAAGYQLLRELGALDENGALTPLGHELGRLPIDPTLGRMLLHSREEHATGPLLIIAAGLSIQDPRERPLDQAAAATAAHQRFVDARSDFLTLLNLWNHFHEQWETLRTQNQRRRFCRTHFLSYLRMREWQDLHAQLHEALADLGTIPLEDANADYDAIHRSILVGLLGHVARRAERNVYQTSGRRPVKLFPTSGLYLRTEPGDPGRRRRGRNPEPASAGTETPLAGPKAPAGQPEWIVAGEWVETSQVFARTAAAIRPDWIVQLAPHLCKLTHHHPHWSAAAGRVVAEEKIHLNGLEICSRQIAYGNVHPQEATAIFIRSALVEEQLMARDEERASPSGRKPRHPSTHALLEAARADAPLPSRYAFITENRQVRDRIATRQTRVRRHDLPDLDHALFNFYAQRLQQVASRQELDQWLRGPDRQRSLCATEADLIGQTELAYDTDVFPESVLLGGQPVALSYAYAPGEGHDGVTVRLPQALAQTVSPASVAWSIPGLREEQTYTLLRSLPKAVRRELMPLPAKVAEIVREFAPSGAALLHDLARFLRQRYQVAVDASAWTEDALPTHLRPRVEILGSDGRVLAAGRDLEQLRRQLSPAPLTATSISPAWDRAAAQWERPALTGWTFGDLPARVTVSDGPGLPVYGWPGLQIEEEHVSVRLFPTHEAARQASAAGVARLVELALPRDFAWLQRDLRAVARLGPLLAAWMPLEELPASAFEHLKRHLLPAGPLPALTETEFKGAVDAARGRLPGLAQRFLDRLEGILKFRQEILKRCAPASAPPTSAKSFADLRPVAPGASAPASTSWAACIGKHLESLLGRRFLERTPFEQLEHFPRYLKAMSIRAERASLQPAKDQERERRLAPYHQALVQLEGQREASADFQARRERFRWMLEEFRVSIFAQELGTAYPVSPPRLDACLQAAREAAGAS
jgi:ATP-dependent helicase HrpA